MSDADLLDALCARQGIVCAVGAGGKKSTLYRILAAHPGHVACTTTVFTQTYPPDLPAYQLVAEAAEIVERALEAAAKHQKIAFACPSTKPDRNAGLTSTQVADCHLRGDFDLTLVKADGARMRPIKAPKDDEPNLVTGTTTVLGLVSARVMGLPLSESIAHRPDRVASVVGAQAGEVLQSLHIARLIASPEGLFHKAGAARRVPVINAADTPNARKNAIEAAHIALDLSDRYDHVVVAAMRQADPVVEVVAR